MAYISTPEVRAIRQQLKEAFPQLKFGVSKQHHSPVDIIIKAGTVDFSDITDERGHAQINQYHLNRTGRHQKMFEKMLKIIHTAPASVPGGRAWFDDSDAMTDYFHTAFYYSISVGSWSDSYTCSKPKPKKVARKPKAVKLPKQATISDAAESVARMNAKEQDKFVEDIVTRYPNLADTLMTKLGYGLLETQ